MIDRVIVTTIGLLSDVSLCAQVPRQTCMMTNEAVVDEKENTERRNAELEFIESAYESNEAWSTTTTGSSSSTSSSSGGVTTTTQVYRMLRTSASCVNFLITIELPANYPGSACLRVVSVSIVKNDNNSGGGNLTAANSTAKAAHNATNNLYTTCCDCVEHETNIDEESIFIIFACADEWLDVTWPTFLTSATNSQEGAETSNSTNAPSLPATISAASITSDTTTEVARCLIYSHHIIGKQKRADMKALGKELDITGYIKIGWPGILLLEGCTPNVLDFYKHIKRWNWQYITQRGIVYDTIPTLSENWRKFPTFPEIEDMSILADHCRTVDMESLFLTSMKVYNNDIDADTENTVKEADIGKKDRKSKSNKNTTTMNKILERTGKFTIDEDAINNNNQKKKYKSKTKNKYLQQSLPTSSTLSEEVPSNTTNKSQYYGALLRVDHMNDGKRYRKWLYKTCLEYSIEYLLIKQCHSSSTKHQEQRPLYIIVLLVDTCSLSIQNVIVKWRITKGVDVNSKGHDCYERMMDVVVEGSIPSPLPMTNDNSAEVAWNYMNSNSSKSSYHNAYELNTIREVLIDLLTSIVGAEWSNLI